MNLFGQVLGLCFWRCKTFGDDSVDRLVDSLPREVTIFHEGQSGLKTFLLGHGIAVCYKLFYQAQKLKKNNEEVVSIIHLLLMSTGTPKIGMIMLFIYYLLTVKFY